MKGINAKKLVALAAGAVLLGSSVVAANVMYQNTELVNDNGVPTVKIVVGSAAQVSDGVAAANIASAIANMAYKSSTLSAKVMGDATCTAGGSGSGAGTCEVSNKKVTLDIEVPGVLGNAYQFKTLITDTLDKTLGNRINSLSEDNYTSTDTSDVSTTLSPLRKALGDVQKSKNLFRVGGDQFYGFATKTITDPQAGGQYSYQVEQNFWTGTSADGVIYDSGSSYRQVVAKLGIAAYNLRFLGNDFGIPFCTRADESGGTGNWAWCANDTSSTYATANHRVRMPFLGSADGWVISSLSAPSTALSSSTTTQNGGIVKLAKEAKYDIVNVGGELDAGTMKIRLADISVATGTANVHPAIIDVLDAAGAVIGQIQVNPGETYTFTQSGTSNQIKVHVYRTAPGFTLNAKWAEIAIYTDEITLQDGQRYNLASSGDPNYNVKVSLIWKNKDYVSSGTNSTQADSLREIVLYDEDTFIGKKYVAGDKYNFPKDGSVFRMTYNGLDLTDGDYTPVTVSALTSTDYPVSSDGNDCATTSNRVTYAARLIQFKTDGNNFGGTTSNLLGDYKLDSFYFDPVGGVANSSGDGINGTAASRYNGTQGFVVPKAQWVPVILYKPAGYSCYISSGTVSSTVFARGFTTGSTNHVRFEVAGADSGAYGAFYFAIQNSSGIGPSGSVNGTFFYQEDAGKNNTVSHVPVYLQFPFINSSDTWRFKSQDSSTSNTYYLGIRDAGTTSANFGSFEPVYVTERGTKVTSVGTTDVQMLVAKKIAQPTFTFSPVSSEGTTSTTGREEVLGEGESITLTNGVKITVKKITETVGSCVASTTGGSPSCTVDTSGLSAVIQPDNTASVETIVPVKLASALVMTDKDAGSAGVIISVGGPVVNTVTADALQSAPVDFQTTNVVVKEVGNKIVVAGYSAADTMTAAQQFIAGISKK